MIRRRDRRAGHAAPGLHGVRVAVRRAVLEVQRPGQAARRDRRTLTVRRMTAERDGVADAPRERTCRHVDHGPRQAVVDEDLDRRGARREQRVRDPQPDRPRAGRLIREGRAGDGRVVVLAIAIEIPGVGQGSTFGVRRVGAVEGHDQGGCARGRRRGDRRGRCLIPGRIRDPMDGPTFEVDVEQVAARSDLQGDRVRRAGDEGLDLRRIGQAVGPCLHRPDAVARVIGEEQRVRHRPPGRSRPGRRPGRRWRSCPLGTSRSARPSRCGRTSSTARADPSARHTTSRTCRGSRCRSRTGARSPRSRASLRSRSSSRAG